MPSRIVSLADDRVERPTHVQERAEALGRSVGGPGSRGPDLRVILADDGPNSLAAQRCSQLSIINNTGTAIGVRQDGAGAEVPVFDQSYFTFYGLNDAGQLSLRRVDQSNTQVTVAYRWEG